MERQRERSRSHPRDGRPGYNLLSDLHCWPEAVMNRLDIDRVVENLSAGILLTTHYSGMGTAEIACSVLHAFLEERQLVTSNLAEHKFKCYSACDINRTCQEVLLQHRQEKQNIEWKPSCKPKAWTQTLGCISSFLLSESMFHKLETQQCFRFVDFCPDNIFNLAFLNAALGLHWMLVER
eukprot:6459477-Amphidinium_carterae.2